MYEIMFVALIMSIPLWLIVDKLSDIDRHLQEILYDDEEEEEGSE